MILIDCRALVRLVALSLLSLLTQTCCRVQLRSQAGLVHTGLGKPVGFPTGTGPGPGPGIKILTRKPGDGLQSGYP